MISSRIACRLPIISDDGLVMQRQFGRRPTVPPFDRALMFMSNDYPIVVRSLRPAIARRITILHLTPPRMIEGLS